MSYPQATAPNIQNSNATGSYQPSAMSCSSGANQGGLYGSSRPMAVSWTHYGYGYPTGGQYPVNTPQQDYLSCGPPDSAASDLVHKNYNRGSHSQNYLTGGSHGAPPPPPPQQHSQIWGHVPATTFVESVKPYVAPLPLPPPPPPPPPAPVNAPPITIPCPPMPPTFPWISAGMFAPFREDIATRSDLDGDLPVAPNPAVIRGSDTRRAANTAQKQVEESKPAWSDSVIDPTLPKILRDMFQPLYCRLCTLTLSSPVVAMDHFRGKRHKKMVEQWFEENPQYSIRIKKVNGSASIGDLQNIRSNQNDGGSSGPRNPVVSPLEQQKCIVDVVDQLNSWRAGNLESVGPGSRWGSKSHGTPIQNNTRGFGIDRNVQPRLGANGGHPRSSGGGAMLSGANAMPLGQGPREMRNPQGPNSRPLRPDQGPWSRPPDLNIPRMNEEIQPLMSVPMTEQLPKSTISDFANNVPRLNTPRWQGPSQGKRPLGPGPLQGPPTKKDKSEAFPSFCEVCSIGLSSKVVADQHFAGKRHKESLANRLKSGGNL